MSEPATGLIISCEHASNAVPPAQQALFANAGTVLASHRGFDPGTAEMAWHIANRLHAPLLCGEWSRLLVDLNRSASSEQVFSEWTAPLNCSQRAALLSKYHSPWRARFSDMLGEALAHRPKLLHLSVHSFTPVLNGQQRELDIGCLFDPQRPWETELAGQLINALQQRRRDWRIRANQPYLGTDDGHTTALRQQWPQDRYAGLEIEINQALVYGAEWPRLQVDVTECLRELIGKKQSH